MTTILPEWENPQIFNINRIAPKAHFIRYNSAEKAKSENTANNPFYQSLNGQWKFNWVKKPAALGGLVKVEMGVHACNLCKGVV